jgi:endonuclease/exonuclease/phosphatase family metal-dependent hydrolase
LILGLAAAPLAADPLRFATFNPGLSREGPGLLLRDILKGEPEVLAVAEVIATVAPDVILLTAFDYDLDGHALAAFAARIEEAGAAYPHRFAFLPNAGMATGLDLDGDGRAGGPRDAQGYGAFAGQAGMAILSRLPIDTAASRDFSAFLWADLPGAIPPEGTVAGQRLSSVGHWDVAVALPDGRPVRLWAWYATPPVFDGPEDRNGRRNHDEAAFWLRYLDGALPVAPEAAPFVLMGDANLDPVDGDGRAEALLALLDHPRLIDARPRSAGGAAAAARDGGVNAAHGGDPALDTADWPDGPGQPGNLRVDYVMPSSDWRVVGSGVWWPDDAPVRHRLVWVDVELP